MQFLFAGQGQYFYLVKPPFATQHSVDYLRHFSSDLPCLTSLCNGLRILRFLPVSPGTPSFIQDVGTARVAIPLAVIGRSSEQIMHEIRRRVSQGTAVNTAPAPTTCWRITTCPSPRGAATHPLHQRAAVGSLKLPEYYNLQDALLVSSLHSFSHT